MTSAASDLAVGTDDRPAATKWWEPFALLVGHRRSILRVTSGRGGLLLGALLVLSAAVAREYDAVSLWHEPADLFAPFAASLLLATFLLLIIQAARHLVPQSVLTWWSDYRTFLTGYWMTAPLAWLYAIPIETMTSEINAVHFNLTLLSIVSLWRVFLFSWIVAVCFQLPFWVALVWISLPSAVIAFFGLLNASLQLVGIMGGLQLTEAERVVRDYQSHVLSILLFGSPTLLFAWIASIPWLKRRRLPAQQERVPKPNTAGTFWCVPIFALAVGAVGLNQFEPPLYRAARVDRLLLAGDIDTAVGLMRLHGPRDFPPRWNPPPRLRKQSQRPDLESLVAELKEQNAPQWISERLLQRAPEILLRQTVPAAYVRFDDLGPPLERLSIEQLRTLEQTASTLQKLDALNRSEEQQLGTLWQALNASIDAKSSQPEDAGDSTMGKGRFPVEFMLMLDEPPDMR